MASWKVDANSTPTGIIVGCNGTRIRYEAIVARPSLGNVALATTLLPAMKAGQSLTLQEPVCSEFLTNVRLLQEIFSMWFGLRPIEIEAPICEKVKTQNGVAAFFSGGLDSWYTLLTHYDELDGLIYIDGTGREGPRQESIPAIQVRQAANELALPLTVVRTDARLYLDQTTQMRWGHTHEAVLAAAAHLLAERFAVVYVPASHTWNELAPWGSHPLTDPLWSSASVKLKHDGCGATRIDKARVITESDVAMRLLHVCTRNIYGNNCGQCEKCQRTLVNLRILGREAPAFHGAAIDLRRISNTRITTESSRAFFRENLAALKATGGDPALAAALQRALKGPSKLQKLGIAMRQRVQLPRSWSDRRRAH